MLGNMVQQISCDSGKRRLLNDAFGKPVKAWDDMG
jgi:hypothetical protein